MSRRVVLCVLSVLVAVSGALAGPGGRLAAARAADHSNVVIDWNHYMLTTLAAANVPPPAATRLGAIVQAAVFDAVNGVERSYTAIHVAPAAPDGTSPKAAAVGAAYTALVSLFPLQRTALDADLAASIAGIGGACSRSPI